MLEKMRKILLNQVNHGRKVLMIYIVLKKQNKVMKTTIKY
ncbi:hypothetical protein AAULH_11786 [Lactobacillus helveticus MTCC 5463]|nr:hypothetical protein AAULH_11786 [Lactobacillus helveticus MTCC 5463]